MLGHGARPLNWTLFGQAMRASDQNLKMFLNTEAGKGINYREISGEFGISASTACQKKNTAGNDEKLFTLVPVPGHGARVLPLELAPVPWHGAQIRGKVGFSSVSTFHE